LPQARWWLAYTIFCSPPFDWGLVVNHEGVLNKVCLQFTVDAFRKFSFSFINLLLHSQTLGTCSLTSTALDTGGE
jgi:hypothetical protein